MTGFSRLAIKSSSPSGKLTMPPLLHSRNAFRIFGVSSLSWPLGYTVHLLRRPIVAFLTPPGWRGLTTAATETARSSTDRANNNGLKCMTCDYHVVAAVQSSFSSVRPCLLCCSLRHLKQPRIGSYKEAIRGCSAQIRQGKACKDLLRSAGAMLDNCGAGKVWDIPSLQSFGRSGKQNATTGKTWKICDKARSS